MQAAARGHVAIITLLRGAGASVTKANKFGKTARDWGQWAPDTMAVDAALG